MRAVQKICSIACIVMAGATWFGDFMTPTWAVGIMWLSLGLSGLKEAADD